MQQLANSIRHSEVRAKINRLCKLGEKGLLDFQTTLSTRTMRENRSTWTQARNSEEV